MPLHRVSRLGAQHSADVGDQGLPDTHGIASWAPGAEDLRRGGRAGQAGKEGVEKQASTRVPSVPSKGDGHQKKKYRNNSKNRKRKALAFWHLQRI